MGSQGEVQKDLCKLLTLFSHLYLQLLRRNLLDTWWRRREWWCQCGTRVASVNETHDHLASFHLLWKRETRELAYLIQPEANPG